MSAARRAGAAREQVFHPALLAPAPAPAPALHTDMEEIQREYEAIPEEYLDTSTRLPGLVRQSTLGELMTSLIIILMENTILDDGASEYFHTSKF